MIKDRGMKKWTAMMLPEHSEQLKEWDDQLAKPKHPMQLMPWELAEIQQRIDSAQAQKLPLTFTIFMHEQWKTVTGMICKIDSTKAILLLDTTDGLQKIPFDSIRGADIDD